MKNIRILDADENWAIAIVAAAEIEFGMDKNGKVGIRRLPAPKECYVPEYLMKIALKEVEKRILEEREKAKIKSLQTKLPL